MVAGLPREGVLLAQGNNKIRVRFPNLAFVQCGGLHAGKQVICPNQQVIYPNQQPIAWANETMPHWLCAVTPKSNRNGRDVLYTSLALECQATRTQGEPRAFIGLWSAPKG